jgi:hypothetical protein
MIFKKQIFQPDRKVHPLTGVFLFLISIVLLLVTGPFGLAFGIIRAMVLKGIRGLGEYFLKIAVSVDQLGNVLMQHLLNALWAREGGYAFGNRDETISSALGRNRKLGTLTGFGLAVDAFLDAIDPEHSLNSIDYYIEPSPAIIDRISFIHTRDNKVLFLKEEGMPFYFLPGGPRIAGESDADRLNLYLSVQLGILGNPKKLVALGTYENRYDLQHPAVFLRQHCYTMPLSGVLQTAPGLEGPYWLGYEERTKLTGPDKVIMEALLKKGVLT